MLVYLASFLLISSGGLSWFFVKMHSSYKFPVEFSICYRQLLASIFMFAIAKMMNLKLKISREEFKLCLVIALLYYCLYFLGAYYGSMFLVSGIVATISSTKIFFVESFLARLEKRKISGRIAIGIVFGITGVFLLSIDNMKIEGKTFQQILLGLLISFVAPLSNATSNTILHISPVKKKLNNFIIVAYCSAIGAVMTFILGILKHQYIPMIPLEQKYIIGLLFLSFMSSGIAIVCSYYLIDKIGSVKTTFMSMAHPPSAFLLAILFQGYKLKITSVLGMILCLYALYIGLRYQTHRKKYIELSLKKKLFMRQVRKKKRELKKIIYEKHRRLRKNGY